MNKSFEYRGYWWRPDNPERQVAGILTFIPSDKIELELIGDFYEDSLLARSNTKESVVNGKKVIMCSPKDSTEAVIHGKIYDEKNHAKDVTLLSCFQGKWTSNLDCNFPIIRYKPWCVILDRHLSDFNECTFNRLRAYTPVMNSWLFPGAIQYSNFDKEDKTKISKICWEIEPSKNMIPTHQVSIDDDFMLSFYSTVNSNTAENNLKINLSQATAFEFAKRQGKATLSELYHKMCLFLHFLNLASLNPTPLEKLVLYDNDHGETYGSKFTIRPMSLYFIPQQISEPKKMSDIHCLFTFGQVSNVFQSLFQKWYSDADTIAPIRNHLVSSIVRKSNFDSGDFLVIVQALEGYHRRFVNNKKLSLKKRLQNMVSDFKFVDRIKLTDDDLDAIVQSRDYYSHFFQREEKPLLLDGKELFFKYAHLRVLLICCILRLIGLQDDIITELIKNCRNPILNTEYS